MRSRIVWIILALVCALTLTGLTQSGLSALQEPGPLEIRTANAVKHILIRLASRQGVPGRPADTKTSVEVGGTHYGLDCGICHGVDGRSETPAGRWMYPRAADLTSKRVQSYSDQELFWIINNGIRFTGMPGFSKVETPDHIWDLVNYMRTLPGTK